MVLQYFPSKGIMIDNIIIDFFERRDSIRTKLNRDYEENNRTALYMPPKGFPTTQIDMYVSEDIGLYKLDVLSQRGLGHIKDCLGLIRQNRGVDVNIHDSEKFKKDEHIRENIKNGNTIGCFYIESPAMLRKLS